MVVLQLCCPKLCSRLPSIEVDFYFKRTKNRFFEVTLSGLRGNVCTPSVACWKAHGRLYIRRNWTFRYLLRLIRYKRKCAEVGVFRRGGGSLWAQISDGRGIAHQPLLVSENQSDCPFVWYKNICSASFIFVTVHACDRQTDGRTDRITTLKTALAYARAVKMKKSDTEEVRK